MSEEQAAPAVAPPEQPQTKIVKRLCLDCYGSGQSSTEPVCPSCLGSPMDQNEGAYVTCSACHGTGRVNVACGCCAGEGWVEEEVPVAAESPAGAGQPGQPPAGAAPGPDATAPAPAPGEKA